MFRYELIVAVVLFLIVPATVFAQDGPEDAFAGSAPAFDQSTPERADQASGDWGVAEQSGAATYTYPIEVPPGRGGMQPELALRYSSQAPLRGGIAAGWSLNIPEIKLDRSRGEVEGRSHYRVSMGGVSGRLIEVPDEAPPSPFVQSTTYRAEFDGTFTRFIYRRRSQAQEWEWMALTTDGVKYFFDDDELPSIFKRTRWHVTRQVDPHGNEIRYFWEPVFKGGGERGEIVNLILDRIEYAANPEAGIEPHVKLEFTYDDEWATCFGSQVPMGAALYNNLGDSGGGYLQGALRLRQISIHVKDKPQENWRLNMKRMISFGYNIDRTPFDPDEFRNACREIIQDRDLHYRFRYLTRITESYGRGMDGINARLPATVFRYAHPDPSLEFNEQRTVRRGLDHFGTTSGAEATLQDIDGDGLLDRVTAAQEGGKCVLHWNKGFFGGDIAGGDGFLLKSFKELDRCTINGGSSTQSNGQLITRTQTGFHFLDFSADGMVDLLTNRWTSTESILDPSPQPAKARASGSPRARRISTPEATRRVATCTSPTAARPSPAWRTASGSNSNTPTRSTISCCPWTKGAVFPRASSTALSARWCRLRRRGPPALVQRQGKRRRDRAAVLRLPLLRSAHAALE